MKKNAFRCSLESSDMTASWTRILGILWFVQFLTTMAMTLGLTFVPFYLQKDPFLLVTDEGDRIFYTSLILAGPFFTTFFAAPLWGWLGDQTGRKQQVIRATIGLGVAQLLMGFAVSPAQLVVIRLLQGMVSGVVAANLGLISAVTPPEHQGKAISLLQSSNTVGMILGPVIGGLLASLIGFRPVYWIIGGVILTTSLLAWRLIPSEASAAPSPPSPSPPLSPSGETSGGASEGPPPQPKPKPKPKPNPFLDLKEALFHAWGILPLRVAFGALILSHLGWALSQAVFAIYAGKLILAALAQGSIAPSWWNEEVVFTSLCVSATGITSFALSFGWGRWHDSGKRALMPLASGLVGIGTFLLIFWPPWWLVFLARLSMGGGLSGLSSLPYATISAYVPQAERSKYMGLGTSMIHLGNLTGFLLGGALARWGGESANFLTTSLLCLVVLVSSFAMAAPKPQL